MDHQIEGFDDDNGFIIIEGILYKKEKYNISNRYKYMLVKNIPYDERLEEEACGFDDQNIKSNNNEEKITIIDKVKKYSLNYKDDKYFDKLNPCKKNKKSKKKILLSKKKNKKK